MFYETEIPRATRSEIVALQTSAAAVAQLMRSKSVPLNAEGQIDVKQPMKLIGWLGFTKTRRVQLEGWAMKPFRQMKPLALILSEAGVIYQGSFEMDFAVVGRRVVIFSKLLPLEQLDISVNALHEIRDFLRQMAEGYGITDLPI